MNIGELTSLLLLLHITTGGGALLIGTIPLFAKKGNKLHRVTGKIFFWLMLSSALIAMAITFVPNHHNPFLFGVGLFSAYLVFTGKRALKYKHDNIDLKLDKSLALFLILSGSTMLIYPLLTFSGSINIIAVLIGIGAITYGLRDFIRLKNTETIQTKWLSLHITKIVGGYISATTAFLVTNSFFYGVWGWFLPSIVGSFYIAIWLRRIKQNYSDT